MQSVCRRSLKHDELQLSKQFVKLCEKEQLARDIEVSLVYKNRIFMEIKILDATKSFHMLRLHRIKGEKARRERHENSCRREHVRKEKYETSQYDIC